MWHTDTQHFDPQRAQEFENIFITRPYIAKEQRRVKRTVMEGDTEMSFLQECRR